jgi:hypothetical protein
MAKHMRSRDEMSSWARLWSRSWPWHDWTVGRAGGGLLLIALGGLLIGISALATSLGADAPPPIIEHGNGWDFLSVLVFVGGLLCVVGGVGRLVGYDFFAGDD